MTTMNELAARYYKLYSARPDRRWKSETIARKIQEAEDRLEETRRLKERRELEIQLEKEEREERVRQRGDFETFGDRNHHCGDDETYRLACAVRWALRVIGKHEKISTEFAERFAENPVDAMTWSKTQFEHAARYQTAQGLRDMFEAGQSFDVIRNRVMDEVFTAARYPSLSSSPTSNIMDTEKLAADTRLFEILNGDRQA